MSGIRYFDINNLPAMSEENRQLITDLHNTMPTPTFLRMVFPQQWQITSENVKLLADHGMDEVTCRDLSLLQGKEFHVRADLLLAVEERIGKERRAIWEDKIETICQHPMSGSMVPAEIPQLSTGTLELLIEAVRTILGQIVTRNSNACQCAQEYRLLLQQKQILIQMFGCSTTTFSTGNEMKERGIRLLEVAEGIAPTLPHESSDLIDKATALIDKGIALMETGKEEGKGISKTALEKKLESIDSVIKTRFKGDIPLQFAIDISEPPCPHCRNYKELDNNLTLLTPKFLRNIFNIALGGDLPLVSLIPFLESVYSQVYNENMIPPSKKKAMDTFVEKIHLKEIMNMVMEKILSIFQIPMTMTFDGDSPSNEITDATDTLPGNGDLRRMKLTEDFTPRSEISSTPIT
jgi:hypothetical protein